MEKQIFIKIMREKGYVESSYNEFKNDSINQYKRGFRFEQFRMYNLNIHFLDSIPKKNRKYFIITPNSEIPEIVIWGTLLK